MKKVEKLPLRKLKRVRSLNKLTLTCVKYVPIIFAMIIFASLILSYTDCHYLIAEILGNIFDLIVILSFLVFSIVYKFCIYHRLIIYYILINYLLLMYDKLFEISISDENFFILLMILAGISLITVIYAYMKHGDKKSF